ncbi:MAG: PAS domain S-box protein [Methanospirillaceae archaeon]|nr:PAS domain S-box protein [Methanospirillaceae archaeon]
MTPSRSPKDSLKILQSVVFDVILCPFLMDRMNAIEYADRLKRHVPTKPVIIAIGREETENILKALKTGIDFFFSEDQNISLENIRLKNFILQVISKKQAEEALYSSDTNYRTIVEATEDSIYMVDRHARYLYINTPHRIRLALKDTPYESRLYRDFHNPEQTKKFQSALTRVLNTGELYIDEYEEDERIYLRKFIPVKYETGEQALAVTVLSTDITDRVRLEENVTRSASLLAATLESITDGIFVADLSGNIVSYNQKFLEMWFVPDTIINERDEEVLLAYIEDQLINRNDFIEKIHFLRENPTQKSFDVLEFVDGRVFERFTQPQRVGGTIIGRIWSFCDITSQRSTISSLKTTQANYHSVIESTGDSIFMVDDEFCYIYMNSFHQQKLGDIATGYLEKRIRVFLGHADQQVFEDAIISVFANKRPFQDEFTWNEDIYIRRFTPVSDENDEVVRAVTVVLTNITDRKKAEEEIRYSEERLKILFEYAPEAYFVTDIKGNFVDSNRASTELTGYTKRDLEGNNLFTMGLLASFHITKTAVLFARNALGKGTGPDEVIITRKDGKQVYTEIMTYPIRIHEKNLVMTIARDITLRKEAEEALRESEEKNRLLVNNAGEGILVIQGTIIVFANPKSCSLFQMPVSHLEGEDIVSYIISDDRISFTEFLQDCHLHQSDTSVIRSFRIFDAQGTMKWFEIAMVPIMWGEKDAVLFLASDSTDRRRAEDALMQTNKKLNLLSSITRHDILNQITISLAYLDLLKKKNTDEQMDKYIQKQLDATHTIRDQIIFTKEYQDIGVKTPQWQNLGEKLDSIIKELKTDLVSYSPSLHNIEIYADPLLEKVFANLISNSLMHAGDISTITFSIKEDINTIILIYADDGVGIEEKEKNLIFDHGYGKNTGYGLFLSREILSITGLTISERGIPGKGAWFEIVAPQDTYRIVHP